MFLRHWTKCSSGKWSLRKRKQRCKPYNCLELTAWRVFRPQWMEGKLKWRTGLPEWRSAGRPGQPGFTGLYQRALNRGVNVWRGKSRTQRSGDMQRVLLESPPEYWVHASEETAGGGGKYPLKGTFGKIPGVHTGPEIVCAPTSQSKINK